MSKNNFPQQRTGKASGNMTPGVTINALKAQFMADMEMAGLAERSRKLYLDAVEQIVRFFWCSPAELTESQVNHYILERHRKNPAKGTFKVIRFALRFFFQETVGCNWHLFKKK
jgi:hypothetical protein